jgi:hypothetical protein
MQENQNTQDAAVTDEQVNQPVTESAPEQAAEPQVPKKLKRNGLKEEFKKKGEEVDEASKPPMTKEETVKFYEENLPFMKMQDEFEELKYRFNERRIKNLELQVREVEALGYLAQWKAGQDEAQRKHDHEQKMKEEWDAMTPEQQEEYKQKAKVNMKIMEMQAKNNLEYTGDNAHEVHMFVTSEPKTEPIIMENEEKKFCFQVPGPDGFIELCMVPGQHISRNGEGEFIIS